jgi:low temperature requirement protein LtrA
MDEVLAGDEDRTGFVELFFDLIYVFAVTQVTTLLASDLTVAGFARAYLMLALVWWAWSLFTWSVSGVGIESPFSKVALLAGAVSALFAAQALPEVFVDAGGWFAGAYLAVRVTWLVMYVAGTRENPALRRSLLVFAPLSMITPVVIVAGAFAAQPARQWVWAAAVAVDIASAINSGKAVWRVRAAHFAERYALIVIIAIGEAVVGIGSGAEGVKRNGAFVVSVLAAFVIAALLWWSYFGWVVSELEGLLRRASLDRRGRVARDEFTFLHFPMFAGIVTVAVALHEIVAQPNEPVTAGGRVCLVVGVGLFLLSFVFGHYKGTGYILFERLVAVVVLAIIAWVFSGARAVVVASVSAVVMAAALSVELRRWRVATAAGRAL